MSKLIYISLVLFLTVIIVGGISLVGAQGGPFKQQNFEGKGPFAGQNFRGFNPHCGPQSNKGGLMKGFHNNPFNNGHQGMFLGRHITEGTSLKASFYNGDPTENAQVINTLDFVAGKDSARKAIKEFRAAAKNAEFVEITVSAQNHTIDLTKAAKKAEDNNGKRNMFAESNFNSKHFGKQGQRINFLLYHINEGSTLEAIFYDGNPQENASELSKLSFIAGEDSELAFKNAFSEARKDAAYLNLNISPQTHTINLAAKREKMAAFDQRGPQGPRNFQTPNNSDQTNP